MRPTGLHDSLPLATKAQKRPQKSTKWGTAQLSPQSGTQNGFRLPNFPNHFLWFSQLFWCLFVANLPVCGKGCSRLIPAPFLSTPGVQRSLCRDRDYSSGDKRPHCSTSWAQACPDIGPPASARYRHPPANDKRDSSSPASHLRQRVLPSLTPPHALKSLVAL